MSSSKSKSLSFYIGKRYASMKGRNLLVGFISSLSILGLALGVAILVTVLSVMNGFDRELQQRILALVPHITISHYRNDSLMSKDQWQSRQESLEANSSIRATAPYLQLQGMLLANGRSKGIILNGIDPEQEKNISIMEQFVEQGSYDDLSSGEFNILIGEGLAETLNLSLGDKVTLASTEIPITLLGEFPRKKAFTVVGIFKVGSQLDNNIAIVHMNDAQRLYRLGDKVHGLRVQVNDLFAIYDTTNQIRETLSPEDYSYSNWTRDYGLIYESIRFSKTLVGLLLSMLVAVAAFNVIVSLVMVVKDKEGDIAILRTMGTPIKSIRNIFLVQGFIIGLIGTGLGLILGVILSLSVSDIAAWLELVFNVEFLSEDIYPVNYLPSQIQALDLFLVAIVSMGLSLLATLYPAHTAASIDPAQALRYE